MYPNPFNPSPISRKVFFSFHYTPDVQRAHVVRNSWVTKADRAEAGFFDSSVFEAKKRESKESLKTFLRDSLSGTSVTCVLIGSQTALRPWVRYELVRSFQRGNGIFGINIHGINNFQMFPAPKGINPLECLAYKVVGDRVQWLELNGQQWSAYDEVPSMALNEVPYDLRGEHYHTFAARFPTYDWVVDNGYHNLGSWVQKAAANAGK